METEKKLKELQYQLDAIMDYFIKNRDCCDYVASLENRKKYGLHPGDSASAIIGVMEQKFNK